MASANERLAVLRDRLSKASKPVDHAETLTLAGELLEERDALAAQLAEANSWEQLVGANLAALRASGPHLVSLAALEARKVAAMERRATALGVLTQAKVLYPLIVLGFLAVGGSLGWLTFKQIELRIPGFTTSADSLDMEGEEDHGDD